MPEDTDVPSRLLEFDGGYALWHYQSLFDAHANGNRRAERESQLVYSFKKHGRNRALVSAAVRAAGRALGCDAILAVPGHSTAATQLQKTFGQTARRIRETSSRKYNHAAEIDFEVESASLDLPEDFKAEKVLVVDDVATTGKTLDFWRRYLAARGMACECLALGAGKKLNPRDSAIILPRQPSPTPPLDAPVIPLPAGLVQSQLFGEAPVAAQTKTGAERKADFLARRADLGELPPVRDPERRARCEASLREFARTYCSALLDHEPSERLDEYLDELQAAIEGAGKIHVRFTRGGGKTTLVKCALAWGLSTGRLHYAVIFCAAADLTGGILGDIWDVFEFDPTFAEDWPAVAYPIRATDGLQQRFAGQHYHGRRTQMKHSAREIRLPTIEGAPSSGAVLVGRGAGCKTRGLVKGKRRPDMVLLDDLQSREDAKNPRRVRELEAWIDGDVQGLAGSKLLNAVMTSTPIVAGDLSQLYADGGQHPEWRVVEFRMIDGEPEAPELWETYDELWRRAVVSGDSTFAEATAWYREHRDAMDAGLVVLDPLNFDRRLEVSGIQHARNLYLTMGPVAFRAECQLQVRAPVDAVQISPALVASRLNGATRGTLPPGTVQAVAAVDVNAAAGITWCVTAFGPHQTAGVVDYGRWPGNGQRLVPQGATEHETQVRIASGLSEVLRRLLDARLPSPAGTVEQIAAVWVDVGYQRRTVQRVCEVFRARTGRIVFGVQGVGHANYSTGGRHVVQRGESVDYRQLEGDRWFAQDADVWRERTQRAWLAEPGAPGSLSLPGNDAREHAEFAEEATAEVLADKSTGARGVVHYHWTQRPGVGNHYGDALSGTMAMGGWYRLLDDADTIAAIAPSRPRVTPLPRGVGAATPHPATMAGSQPRAAARRARFRSPTMAG